ncbi:MAG: Crp/Fnr family transcriptional regulator [Parasphingorhabdus sp.]
MRLFEELLDTFEIADDDLRNRILSSARIQEYPANAEVISSIEASRAAYLVLEGKAKALLFSGEGNQIWFNDFRKGDFFGEMAAITTSDRSADVYSETALIVAKFDAQDFVSILQSDGQFCFFVTQQIVDRFRKTSKKMFELSALTVAGRTYAELLRIAGTEGAIDGSNLTIDNMPSVAELARRIYSTRETVSRVVNELQQKGFISRIDNKVTILNSEFFTFVGEQI